MYTCVGTLSREYITSTPIVSMGSKSKTISHMKSNDIKYTNSN